MSDAEQSAFGLGYWVFNHKRQVRLFTVGALSLVCAVIWGVVLYHGVLYLKNRALDAEVQNSFLSTVISYSSIARPQALRILSVQAVPHDSTHVDVVAYIKNQNIVFASHHVVGQFTLDGVKQNPISFFVNANEMFYLPQLAIPSTLTSHDVTFSILSTDWFRLHGEVVQDKWVVAGTTYTSLAFGNSSVDLQRQAKTNITNASAYNFKNTSVTVILLQNSDAIGVATTTTDIFNSLTSKDYSFTWSQPLLLNASPVVQVRVDRADPNQILSPNT